MGLLLEMTVSSMPLAACNQQVDHYSYMFSCKFRVNVADTACLELLIDHVDSVSQSQYPKHLVFASRSEYVSSVLQRSLFPGSRRFGMEQAKHNWHSAFPTGVHGICFCSRIAFRIWRKQHRSDSSSQAPAPSIRLSYLQTILIQGL